MMSPFTRNIIANILGKGWPTFVGIACIPLYIRFLGIEAYGLVGVFTALQTVLSLLDLGLSTTANRELARLSGQDASGQASRDLMRTLERVYWSLAILIAVGVAGLAPWLSGTWLRSVHLPGPAMYEALLLMGLAIALQFPSALYAGGLLGLQRQVPYNGIVIVVVTLRGIGAILMLWRVSPTIQAFLAWQAVMSLVLTVATGWLLWRHLPISPAAPRFRSALLRSIWRFAAGMSGISALGVILTQLDKLTLSRLVTLEQFGYYSLATVVASGLYLVASPVYTAAFPRFSQLASRGEMEAVRAVYHKSCQLVAVTVWPMALIIACFARELLLLWTGSAVTAEATHRVLSLLIVGTALNTMAITPLALQLAHGWTRLAFVQNALAVALLAPCIVWMASRYGPAGAAVAWIILNAGYVLVGLTLMHQRLLRGELRTWYLVDTGRPLAASLAVALLCRWAYPSHAAPVAAFGWLAAASALTLAAAAAVAPYPRQWVRQLLAGKKPLLRGEVAP